MITEDENEDKAQWWDAVFFVICGFVIGFAAGFAVAKW